jgi:hypothetical protein
MRLPRISLLIAILLSSARVASADGGSLTQKLSLGGGGHSIPCTGNTFSFAVDESGGGVFDFIAPQGGEDIFALSLAVLASNTDLSAYSCDANGIFPTCGFTLNGDGSVFLVEGFVYLAHPAFAQHLLDAESRPKIDSRFQAAGNVHAACGTAFGRRARPGIRPRKIVLPEMRHEFRTAHRQIVFRIKSGSCLATLLRAILCSQPRMCIGTFFVSTVCRISSCCDLVSRLRLRIVTGPRIPVAVSKYRLLGFLRRKERSALTTTERESRIFVSTR